MSNKFDILIFSLNPVRARFLFHGTNCRKRRRCETDILDIKNKNKESSFLKKKNLPSLSARWRICPAQLISGNRTPLPCTWWTSSYYRSRISSNVPLPASFFCPAISFSSKNWNHSLKRKFFSTKKVFVIAELHPLIALGLFCVSDIRNYAKWATFPEPLSTEFIFKWNPEWETFLPPTSK